MGGECDSGGGGERRGGSKRCCVSHQSSGGGGGGGEIRSVSESRRAEQQEGRSERARMRDGLRRFDECRRGGMQMISRQRRPRGDGRGRHVLP